MNVKITVIDPLGKRKIETLDDGGTGVILIGNAQENSENSGVLRLTSPAISARHALLAFNRAVSATPFERQHVKEDGNDEKPVCHIMVLSEAGNVYRADNTIATPYHQFIPWYRGDAYLVGDYTLIFEHEALAQVPFTVELTPHPSKIQEVPANGECTWQITATTTAERIPNVDLELQPPDGWNAADWAAVKQHVTGDVQPKLLNINETRSGTATLKIVFAPDPRLQAGAYTFTLRASSREYQSYEPRDTKIRINLQRFTAFTFQPQPATAPEQTIPYFRTWWWLPEYWFTLHNQSNYTETFTLSASDDGGKSRYFIEPFATTPLVENPIGLPPAANNAHVLTLAPGAQTDVRVMVRPRGRRHIGLFPKPYKITLVAKPQQGAPPQEHKFTLRQRPFILAWLSSLLLLGLLWFVLWVATPRIIEPVRFSNSGAIAPEVPVTLTWHTNRFVEAILPIELAKVPQENIQILPPTTAWYRWTSDYRALVKFPKQGDYGGTLTAQNRLHNWPIIPYLGIFGIDGQATYTLTATVAPQLTISDTIITAGEVGYNIPLTLSYTSTEGLTATVEYTLVNGTAMYGYEKDYHFAGDTTNIQQTGKITITNNPDFIPISTTARTAYEPPKTFMITLSDPEHAVFPGNRLTISATITITDTQGLPKLTIAPATAAETDKVIVFTPALNHLTDQDIQFTVNTVADSAREKEDYTPLKDNKFTIRAGSLITTIAVGLAPDDPVVDGIKNFKLELKDVQNVQFDSAIPITGTITDDESPPTISISNAEANEAAGQLRFPLTVAPVLATGPITVTFTVEGQTATAGTDFTLPENWQVIIPTSTSEAKLVIAIPTEEPKLAETDETLIVTLIEAKAAQPVKLGTAAKAVGTITDADGLPTLTVEPVRAPESAGELLFTVKLVRTGAQEAQSAQDVRVRYATVAGTATAGSDFTMTEGVLIIKAGDSSGIIRISILKDELTNELDETLIVRLSDYVGVDLKEPRDVVGTILGASGSSDQPSLTIKDALAVPEGNDAVFVVELDRLSATAVSFAYSTVNGTAQADVDFTKADNEVGTIPAGTKSIELQVKTTRDSVANEGAENFTVSLSNVVNARVSDGQATGTISEANERPTISITGSSVAESATLNFNVTLSAPSVNEVTVHYSTSNDSPISDVSATEGNCTDGEGDYQRREDTLRFAPGETQKVIAVEACSDNLANEGTEKFKVILDNPQGAEFANQSEKIEVAGNIDDATLQPEISIAATASGPDSDDGKIEFAVTLTRKSKTSVDVRFSTENGSAIAGTDYQAPTEPNNILTIPAGVESSKISIQLKYNKNFTGNLEFTVKLEEIVTKNAVPANNASTGTGIIIDKETTDQRGIIQIKQSVTKLADNDSSINQNFIFTTNIPAFESFTLNDYPQDSIPDNQSIPGLEPDREYKINVTIPANWELQDITCNSSKGTQIKYGQAEDDSFNGEPVIWITLKPSDTVSCTFKNRQQSGSIKVTKQITNKPNNYDPEFEIQVDCGTDRVESFNLTDGNDDKLENIPAGRECTVTEDKNQLPEPPKWYKFGPPVIEPASGIIQTDPELTVTVTNTIEENPAKVKVCVEPSDSPFAIFINKSDTSQTLPNGCTDEVSLKQDKVEIREKPQNSNVNLRDYKITLSPGCGTLNITSEPNAEVSLAPGQSITCTFINRRLQADLSVTQSSTVQANPNVAPTQYTVTFAIVVANIVANQSLDQAVKVILTNTIPSNATFVSITPSPGTCSSQNALRVCNLGDIDTSSPATIKLVVTTTVIGTISNNVTVGSSTDDPIASNNTSLHSQNIP